MASTGNPMTRATQFPSRARPGPRARWSWAGHRHHCPSCWAGPHTQVPSAAIQPEVSLRKLAAVQFTLNVHFFLTQKQAPSEEPSLWE